MNLKEGIVQFTKYLETSGRSPSTVRSYLWQLGRFPLFLKNNPDVGIITQDQIIDFLKNGQRQRLSDATLNVTKAALAGLFGYLVEAGHINKMPFKRLRYDKIVRKLPRVLDPGEQSAVVAAADRAPDLALLLRVYLDWGLRLSEALKLDVNDFQDCNVVRIIGKRKRVRKLPLTPGIRTALERWLPVREARLGSLRRHRGKKVDLRSLFLTKWGTRPRPRTAQSYLKDLFKRVGLPEVRVHNLRHTLGKRLADAGVHIRTIQDILGHADASTVEIYTPTTRIDISTALEKTST